LPLTIHPPKFAKELRGFDIVPVPAGLHADIQVAKIENQ
jgi:hypothetical protein